MTVLDEALELLRNTGPEFNAGLSNHGPMAAEALVRLDRDDAVLDWVERYRGRLDHHPGLLTRIDPSDWQSALGDVRRVGDWVAFFDSQLADRPWQTVVSTWVPRLAPGLMAAATHGPIRTAHATRAIAESETSQRRHELAEGLGYWAARYQQLPGTPSAHDAGRAPSDALQAVPRVHGAAGRPIFEELRGLDSEPAFVGVIDLVRAPHNVAAFLSEVTETFAAATLANPQAPIPFIHSVTAPSALRMLLPYLEEEDARLAARYVWQAAAGLYAWYADAPAGPTVVALPAVDSAELVEHAVASGDEHAIKFTEACLREHALNPKPVYFAAADAWVSKAWNIRKSR